MIQTQRDRLDAEVLKGLEIVGLSRVNNDLRAHVAIAPTLDGDFHLNKIKSRTKLAPKDFFRLCVIHWYLDPEVAVLIRLMIEEEWTTGPLSEYKNSLLISKESMLATLQIQEIWSSNSFFGELRHRGNANKWKVLLGSLFVPRKSLIVKRIQRRRGYNDKGTMSQSHESKTYDYRKFQDFFDIEESLKWNTAFTDRIDQKVLFQLKNSA